MRILFVLLAGIGIGAAGLYGWQQFASQHGGSAAQPYAGQDARQISSLSADDIRQLENGEGWGLAKPAELNGYPGPAHVLEFADKIALEAPQREKIQQTFNAMNAKARELGAALVDAEAALDRVFKDRTATPALLAEQLALTEKLRAALREVHLAAHLEITPLLTDEQKQEYSALRGYGEGHDGGHTGH